MASCKFNYDRSLEGISSVIQNDNVYNGNIRPLLEKTNIVNEIITHNDIISVIDEKNNSVFPDDNIKHAPFYYVNRISSIFNIPFKVSYHQDDIIVDAINSSITVPYHKLNKKIISTVNNESFQMILNSIKENFPNIIIVKDERELTYYDIMSIMNYNIGLNLTNQDRPYDLSNNSGREGYYNNILFLHDGNIDHNLAFVNSKMPRFNHILGIAYKVNLQHLHKISDKKNESKDINDILDIVHNSLLDNIVDIDERILSSLSYIYFDKPFDKLYDHDYIYVLNNYIAVLLKYPNINTYNYQKIVSSLYLYNKSLSIINNYLSNNNIHSDTILEDIKNNDIDLYNDIIDTEHYNNEIKIESENDLHESTLFYDTNYNYAYIANDDYIHDDNIQLSLDFGDDVNIYNRMRKKFVEEMTSEKASPRLLSLLTGLLVRSGVHVNIVSLEEMSQVVSLINGQYRGEKAFYYKNVIYLNEDITDAVDLLHELLHPFILLYAKEHPSAIASLVTEIIKIPEYAQMYEKAKQYYNDIQLANEEITVLFLTEYFDNTFKNGNEYEDENDSIFAYILHKIIDFIKELLGIKKYDLLKSSVLSDIVEYIKKENIVNELSQFSINDLYANIDYVNTSDNSSNKYEDEISLAINDDKYTKLFISKTHEFDVNIHTAIKKISEDFKNLINNKIYIDILEETKNIFNVSKLLLTGTIIDFQPEIKEVIDSHFNKSLHEIIKDNFDNINKIINSINHISEQRIPLENIEKRGAGLLLLANNMKLMYNIMININAVVEILNDRVNKYLDNSYKSPNFKENIFNDINFNNLTILKELLPYLLLVNKYKKSLNTFRDKIDNLYSIYDVNKTNKEYIDNILDKLSSLANIINKNIDEAIIATIAIITYNSLMSGLSDVENLDRYESLTDYDDINLDSDNNKKLMQAIKYMLSETQDFLSNAKLLLSHKNDEFIVRIHKNKKLLKQLSNIISKIDEKKPISENEMKVLKKGISYFVLNFKNVTIRDIYNIVLYQLSYGSIFEKYVQPVLNTTNNNVYALSLIMRMFELKNIRNSLDTTYEINELDKTLDSLENKVSGTKSVLNNMLHIVIKKISIDDKDKDSKEKSEKEIYEFQYIHKIHDYGYLMSKRTNILTRMSSLYNDISDYLDDDETNIADVIIKSIDYRFQDEDINDFLKTLIANGIPKEMIDKLLELYQELEDIDHELLHYYSFKNSLAIKIEQEIEQEIEQIEDDTIRENIKMKFFKLKMLNERIILLASLLDGLLSDFKEFNNKHSTSLDILVNELNELYSERLRIFQDIFDPDRTNPQELKIIKLFREYYERKTQFYVTISLNIPKFIDAVIKNMLNVDNNSNNNIIKTAQYIRILSNFMRIYYLRDKKGKVLYYEYMNEAYERLYAFYKEHGIKDEYIEKVRTLANYLLQTLQDLHTTDIYSDEIIGLDKLYKYKKDIDKVNTAIKKLMGIMNAIYRNIRKKLRNNYMEEELDELTQLTSELYDNRNKDIRPKIYSDIIFEWNKFFDKHRTINDRITFNTLNENINNILGKQIINGLILSNYALQFLKKGYYESINITFNNIQYEFSIYTDTETGEQFLKMEFNDGNEDYDFIYSIDSEFFKKFDILFIDSEERTNPLLSPFVTYNILDNNFVQILDIENIGWGDYYRKYEDENSRNVITMLLSTYLRGMTVGAQFVNLLLDSRYKTPNIVGLTISTNGEFLPKSYDDNIFIPFANYIIRKYNLTVLVDTLEDAFKVLNDNNNRIQIADFFEFLLDDITNNEGKIFKENIKVDNENKYLNNEFIGLYDDVEKNGALIRDIYKMIIWYLNVQYRYGITNFNAYLEFPRYNIGSSEILYIKKDRNIKKYAGWLAAQLGYNITELNYENIPKDPTKTVEMLADVHVPFFGLNLLDKMFTSKDVSSLYLFVENAIKYSISKDMFPIAYSISYIYGFDDLLNKYSIDKTREYGNVFFKNAEGKKVDVTKYVSGKTNKNYLIRGIFKNFNLKHLAGAQVTIGNIKLKNGLAVATNLSIKFLAVLVFIPTNIGNIRNILANWTSQQLILLANILSHAIVNPSEALVRLLSLIKTPFLLSNQYSFQMRLKKRISKKLDKILQLGFIPDDMVEIHKLRRIYSIRKPLNIGTIGFFLKTFIENYTLIDALSSAMHDKRIKIDDEWFSLDEITEYNEDGYLVTKNYISKNGTRYIVPDEYKLVRNESGKIIYVGDNIIEIINAIKQEVQMQTGGLFNKNTIGYYNEIETKIFLFLKSFYVPYLQKIVSSTGYNINTKRYTTGINTINIKHLLYNMLLIIKSYIDFIVIKNVERVTPIYKKNKNKYRESYKVSEDIVRWTLPIPILMYFDTILASIGYFILHGFWSLFGSDDDDDKEKLAELKKAFDRFENANNQLKDALDKIKNKEEWNNHSTKEMLKKLQTEVTNSKFKLNKLFFSYMNERVTHDKLSIKLITTIKTINDTLNAYGVSKKNINLIVPKEKESEHEPPANLNLGVNNNEFNYNDKLDNIENVVLEYMEKYNENIQKHQVSYVLSRITNVSYDYYDIDFDTYIDIIKSSINKYTETNIDEFKNAFNIIFNKELGFANKEGELISILDMVDENTRNDIKSFNTLLEINDMINTTRTQIDAYYDVNKLIEGFSKLPSISMANTIKGKIEKLFIEKPKTKYIIGENK